MRRASGMSLLILALLTAPVLLSTVSCVSEKTHTNFPYVLRIAPGNALFVHGHEFRDSVMCTWAPGDTLRIGGVPVLPPRQQPRTRLSNACIESLYSQVPYVVSLVDDGYSWQDAADAYNSRREQFARSLVRVYLDALEATGSDSLAAAAAMDSMDWMLVDPSVEPTIRRHSIGLVWRGLRYWFRIGFTDETPTDTAPTLLERVYTQEDVSALVRSLSGDLSTQSRTPRFEIITTGRTLLTGSAARDALRQISEAEKGNVIGGPLHDREVKQILAVKREQQETR